jgi:hypothetical protein
MNRRRECVEFQSIETLAFPVRHTPQEQRRAKERHLCHRHTRARRELENAAKRHEAAR